MSWCVDDDVQSDNTLHVWPLDDSVTHELDGTRCVCLPALEEQANGVVMVTHHSLDGRELSEPDHAA